MDCELVYYFQKKASVIQDLLMMSKVCKVPLYEILFRGQGIRTMSLVLE